MITHKHLKVVCQTLETDYFSYGKGQVVRWENEGESYPDCSSGCKWAAWLSGEHQSDWCVCCNPDSPRAGLLTFEHQAGYKCFEPC